MTRRPRSHELLPARGSQMSLDFWLPRGTWNAKKHSELVRLFGEFIREYDGDQGLGDWEVRGREGWEARGRGPFKPLWKFVLKQIEGNRPKDGRIIDADEVFMLDLGPWCKVVEHHYGMKPHKAIFWLVKQYYDYVGEKKAAFNNKFGAGDPKSIARRLYQKAKDFEALFVEHEWTDEVRIECDAAINEAGTDLTGLYKLTFEMLRLWPEPSVYLGRVGKVRKDK
jgi:hypothetical protein